MRVIQKTFLILGRFSISLIFLLSAIHKIFGWQRSEQGLLNAICDWQSYLHASHFLQDFFVGLIPWVPAVLVFSVVVELLGALMVLFGFKEKLGSFLLILFLMWTTVFFHHFWFLEGAKRQMEFIMFLKNVAILGGLFLLLSYPREDSKEREELTDLENPDLSSDEEN